MAALSNSIGSIVITLMIYAILWSPLLLWSCDAARNPRELVANSFGVACLNCVGCCEPPPPGEGTNEEESSDDDDDDVDELS
ncbi:hypothetical protein K7X08_004151 [Anisodus acutangulus]|uniref:Uncharacterized protein n=1 Tax=Anisodus acutangulus TaxID=402998 RepID=A0A9Q1MH16_9SOLA|nr:hypothetical protein K7X08_004151 [Anisodus acutangulus]